MSQDPRKSSRLSSVNKREELEAKLAKRKVESEIKVLKSRSKAIETLRRQELESYEEEVKRLSDFVDRNYDESDPDNNSNPNQSLEWDSDTNNTSPSFITIPSSQEVSPTVQEIIEEILNSSVNKGEEEDSVPPIVRKTNRRNTSTDDNFLASSPVQKQEPVQFIWPPRFPSQEPEDLSQLNYPPLQLRAQENPELEEVFEAVQEEQPATMDPADYEAKLREIKLAAKKVQKAKKKFVANDVTTMDIHIYEARL